MDGFERRIAQLSSEIDDQVSGRSDNKLAMFRQTAAVAQKKLAAKEDELERMEQVRDPNSNEAIKDKLQALISSSSIDTSPLLIYLFFSYLPHLNPYHHSPSTPTTTSTTFNQTLNRAKGEVESHEASLADAAGPKFMTRDEFKQYGATLREKTHVYKRMKQELGDTRAELVCAPMKFLCLFELWASRTNQRFTLRVLSCAFFLGLFLSLRLIS